MRGHGEAVTAQKIWCGSGKAHGLLACIHVRERVRVAGFEKIQRRFALRRIIRWIIAHFRRKIGLIVSFIEEGFPRVRALYELATRHEPRSVSSVVQVSSGRITGGSCIMLIPQI